MYSWKRYGNVHYFIEMSILEQIKDFQILEPLLCVDKVG